MGTLVQILPNLDQRGIIRSRVIVFDKRLRFEDRVKLFGTWTEGMAVMSPAVWAGV